MKDKIIQQLLTLDVCDYACLVEYVDFCLENDIGRKIINETSLHHILPKAKSLFHDYADLKEHSWNGVHLTHKNHYIAHYMLNKSVDNYSVSKAFMAMHNKDSVLRDLADVLICAEEYDIAKVKNSKMMSLFQNEIMSDGRSRAQHHADKMVLTKRKNGYYEKDAALQLNTPEAIEKQTITLNTVQASGLTRAKEIGLLGSETKRNKESVTCVHCDLSGKKGSNMTRYHFDNCPVNKGMTKDEYYAKRKTGTLHNN